MKEHIILRKRETCYDLFLYLSKEDWFIIASYVMSSYTWYRVWRKYCICIIKFEPCHSITNSTNESIHILHLLSRYFQIIEDRKLSIKSHFYYAKSALKIFFTLKHLTILSKKCNTIAQVKILYGHTYCHHNTNSKIEIM
jgi:hypothetical protein